MVDARLTAANASISTKLGEVQTTATRGSTWWPQFGMALLLSVIAPTVLGLTLMGIGAFDKLVPTPSQVKEAIGDAGGPRSAAPPPVPTRPPG